MSAFLVIVAVLVVCPTVVVLLYPVLVRILLGANRHAPAATGAESVAIIVPCQGAGEGRAALASIAVQITSRPSEVVFCVEDHDDPVVPLLEALVREQPRRCRMQVTGASGRDLGKLHNLMAGVDGTTAGRIVFVDSDVTFEHERALDAWIADLDRDGVGLVSGFPAYRGARNLPAAILTMTINHDLLGCFAWVACVRSLAVANGSCLAVRRSVLEAAGGLGALRNQVLMDTTLARRVAALGYRVHVQEQPAPIIRRRATWRECWQQALRWQVSMRRALPLSHYLGFLWLRCAGAWALVGLAASSFSPASWIVAGSYFTARASSAFLMDARYLRSGSLLRFAWALPLVEIFNAVTVSIALFSRTIEWGGRRYRVHSHGRVTRMTDVDAARRKARTAA